jgi:hypothetical protein
MGYTSSVPGTHCDLEKFGSLLADDLEFYHDKSGLSSGRQALVEAIKNNICGKVTREPFETVGRVQAQSVRGCKQAAQPAQRQKGALAAEQRSFS